LTEYPLVSVVIPHYITHECLKDSMKKVVEKTSYPDYEIIISDDFTNTPENTKTLEWIRDEYNCQVLFNPIHGSMAYAINRGVDASKGEYIIVLSNDVFPVEQEDWIEIMVKYMQENPKVGGMSPRSMTPNNKVYYVGARVRDDDRIRHIDYGRANAHPPTAESPYTNAACMIVSRKLFDEVGGFDERFIGLGLEDVDFGYKLRAAGYKVLYFSEVTMCHLVEVTTKALNNRNYLGPNEEIFLSIWETFT